MSLPATLGDTDCRMSSPRYLSLWLGLQHIGHDGVATRIQHSLNLVATHCELLRWPRLAVTVMHPSGVLPSVCPIFF